MALLKQHVFSGITVNDAYHKVNYVSGNKNNLTIDVCVSKDATEDAAGNVLSRFCFVMGTADLVHDDGSSDKNYTKQAYVFMKAAAFQDLTGATHDYTSAVDA